MRVCCVRVRNVTAFSCILWEGDQGHSLGVCGSHSIEHFRTGQGSGNPVTDIVLGHAEMLHMHVMFQAMPSPLSVTDWMQLHESCDGFPDVHRCILELPKAS